MPTDEEFERRELEQQTRDITYQLRKEMNDLGSRMFLRTTMCFMNVGLFGGKDATKMYGNEYTGNHIAIFECELKAPPQLSFIDHNIL